MYYLKYRSQALKELDNRPVREQLEKVLKSETIPHAFLFTGPKGTGKTSAARIVAKILNASENEKKVNTLDPDLEDEKMHAISKGNSPDVIEIDAASNRRIDDVRELIAQLKFSPLVSKYKIYIIDEVHMLTKEAFNALLKSLEEPPASTIFILATTEMDDLPKTITSRCMVIHFGYATADDLLGMLKRIDAQESLSVSDDVLKYIAEHAQGSFRDAAKMLEMAVMQDAKSMGAVQKAIGRGSAEGDILSVLDSGTLTESLAWIEESAKQNANFRILIESMLETLHKVLLVKNGIEVELKTTYTFSSKDVAVLIGLLQKAYQELKYTPIPSLPLELAIVDFFGHKDAKN